MACQICISYQNQLQLKKNELNELRKKFADCKLQSEVHSSDSYSSFQKVDGKNDDLDNCAKLLARVSEAEKEVERLDNENELLRNSLAAKESELSDHVIKIRNLEEQLRAALENNVSDIDRHPGDVEVIAKHDLDRLHSQLFYKDTRIMELNSTILDKERQILDLQEMCREQSQVVQARSKAFQIVQQRVMELDSKKTRDVSTETDVALVAKLQNQVSLATSTMRKENFRRSVDSSIPGRAVMLLRTDRHSPPPVDPSEDQSSVTTETLMVIEEGEGVSKVPLEFRRKHRKKVTFDLKPQLSTNIEGLTDSVCDDIAQAVIDLTSENDELRKIIRELENDTVASAHSRIAQLEEEVEKVRREGKNQALKAKAAAQGRMRDLEEKIAFELEEHKEEVNRFKSTVEALRTAREWSIEENARLLEQIATSKQQCDKIKEELNESLVEQEKLRRESEKDREMIVRLAGNVEEAQRTVNTLLEQKVCILDDVDRLKEAIEAQDEYITTLEEDVVIYEKHIGLLRDSLGASKIENRAFIKSKAFETKLRALEQEKEQITKRNNDERIRVRALNAKIRSLESQNAELVEKLRKVDPKTVNLHRKSIEEVQTSCSVNGDFIVYWKNEKTPCMKQTSCYEHSHISVSRSMPNLLCEIDAKDLFVQGKSNSGTEKLQLEKICKMRFAKIQESEKQLSQQFSTSQAKLVQTSGSVVGEIEELEDLKDELKIVQDECNSAKERIQHMECENFELEIKLKEAAKKLEDAEEKNKSFEEKLNVVSTDFKAREEKYITEIAALVKKDAETDELMKLKDEKIQVIKEKMAQLQGEKECKTVDLDEVNNNPAAESWCSSDLEFDERLEPMVSGTVDEGKSVVSKKNLKTEEDNVTARLVTSEMQRTSHVEIEKLIEKEKFMEDTIKQKDSEIILLRSAVEKYTAELQEVEHWKDERKLLESQLLAVTEEQASLAEDLRAELRMEFSTTQAEEQAVFANELAEKEKSWKAVICQKETEIATLQRELHELESELQEYEALKNDFSALTFNFEELQNEKATVTSELEATKARVINAEEENFRLEKLLEEVKTEYSSLKGLYGQVRSELETEKEEFCTLYSKLNSLTEENKEKARRLAELGSLDNVILEANHLKKQCRLLTEEKASLTKKLENLNNEIEAYNKDGSSESSVSHGRSKEGNEGYASSSAVDFRACLSVTATKVEDVMITSSSGRGKPDVICGSSSSQDHGRSSLEIENVILRECVAQNTAMQDTLSEDVNRLLDIRTELETTVEALKGEIWSLNNQLKAAITDRDDFSDKLCELTQLMENEREEARERERELEEQKDFAERSQRQTALAENESNRRLVEWQEKTAEMENNYTQLRTAYEQLTAYYQQVQEAYNTLYASIAKEKTEMGTETEFQEVGHNISTKATTDHKSVVEVSSSIEVNANDHAVIAEQLRSLRQSVEILKTQDLDNLKTSVASCFASASADLERSISSALSEVQQTLSESVLREIKIIGHFKNLSSEIIGSEVVQSVLKEPDCIPALFHRAKSTLQATKEQNLDLRQALEEKRAACFLLESRLEECEKKLGTPEVEPSPSRSYVMELEAMLDSTQMSLRKQLDKIDELQQRLSMMESLQTGACGTESLAEHSVLCGTIPTPSSAAAAHMICRRSLKLPCSANLQLAILAARLTTREADNNALFRCNEELAETNLKLQNQVDMLQEKLRQLSVTELEQDETNEKEIQSLTSQSGFGSDLDNNENNWNWDTDAGSSTVRADELAQTEEANGIEALLEKLQSKEEEIKHLQEKEKKFCEEIQRLEKRLEAAEEYGLEMEAKIDGLEGVIEKTESELKDLREKSSFDKEGLGKDEDMFYANSLNTKLTADDLEKEKNALLGVKTLEKRWEELNIISTNAEKSNFASMKYSGDLQEPFERMGAEGNIAYGWSEYEVDLPIDVRETVSKPEEKRETDVQELKATIEKLNGELSAVIKSRESLEIELSLSNDRFKNIESDYQKLNQQLSVCKKELESVQVPSVETSFTETIGKGSMVTHSRMNETCSCFTKEEMQLSEESYLALIESEKSLRRLLEGLETKLHDTEEYSVNLSEENTSLKSTVADLKAEVTNLKEKIVNIRNLNEGLQRENEELKNKVYNYERIEAEKNKLEKDLKIVRLEVEELTALSNSLREQKAEVTAQLQSLLVLDKEMKDVKEFSVQVELNNQVENLRDQLEKALKEKEKLENDLSSARKQNELLQDCECRLTDVVNDYEAKLLVNTNEILHLRSSLEEVNANYAVIDRERNELLKSKDELQASLNIARSEFNSLSKELIELRKSEAALSLSATTRVDEAEAIRNKKEQRNNFDLSTSDEVTPSGSKQSFIEKGEDDRKDVDSYVEEKKQMTLQVREMEVKCEKFLQEKKKMLRKIKHLQAELNSSRQEKSNNTPGKNSPSSSSFSLPNESYDCFFESPVSRFAVGGSVGSTHESPKFMEEYSNEKVTARSLESVKNSTVVEGSRLHLQNDESVRRRRSGFRDAAGQ